ncbi:McrC family protein [Allobranchiibius sp. CTAmp26]|uniref:McrC family protein n=1 Tax=Allobranchiibius sp. CTAmp26 TaxID=2815214 RepID=UPI001AA1B7AE|nr:restriction endonuclease [Allobranchiibius sp. CTAmp26]MBO1755225.1 restriction endonuclease [Allobranchiibius sp. CTAmp26]
MRTVTLTEHSTSDPLPLDRHARAWLLELAAGRLEVLATTDPTQVRLRSTSWVGAVRVPGLTVRIAPRAGMANLFTMFSAGIPGGALGRDEVGWEGGADLVDGVAAFLVRAVDDCTRRGLLHGYLHREEPLTVIRGRLLVEQLAVRPWAAARPPCGYDDFTVDVPENRMLRCALEQVLRWPALPPALRRGATALAARFEGVSASVPDDHRGGVAITRLNEHYAAALGLAGQILDGVTISHREGEHRAHAFLIDLQDLFRRWIGAELEARLWPTLHVSEQPAYALDDGDRLPVRPELLVLRGTTPTLVLQARHRLTGAPRSLSEQISPLLLQAASLQVPTALLLYGAADHPPDPELRIRGTGTRLLCLPLSLDTPPDALGARLDELAVLVRVLALGPAPRGNPSRGRAVLPASR